MTKILTSAYFIVPVCIAAIIVGIRIIKSSLKVLIYNKLSDVSNKDTSYVCDILANEYSEKSIIRDALLISASAAKSSEAQMLPCSDIVYVGKCGVILITVINNKGEFDNPKTGTWKYRYKNSSGEIIVEEKINPFDATMPQIKVVSELLKNENVYNNCIKRIVVYTQTKIRFTYDYKEIVNVDNLISAIDRYNKKSILTSAEIRLAHDAIYNYSEYLNAQSEN